jgi:hypothetical protein
MRPLRTLVESPACTCILHLRLSHVDAVSEYLSSTANLYKPLALYPRQREPFLSTKHRRAPHALTFVPFHLIK